MKRGLAVCVFSGSMFMAAASALAQGQPPPLPEQGVAEPQAVTNVAGRWELNWQQSDRPPGLEEEAERERTPPDEAGRGGRGGMGGGMGGRGGLPPGGMGGRGMGRGEPSREDRARMDLMRDMLSPHRTLLIVEHPDRVSITDENGRVLLLRPTGTKTKENHAGASIERITRWEDRVLVTEVWLGGGMKVTQRFQKVQDGLQLVVSTRIEGGRGGERERDIRRVYDQALQ